MAVGFQEGKRDLSPLLSGQAESGAHPAFCSMDPGRGGTGSWTLPLTPYIGQAKY